MVDFQAWVIKNEGRIREFAPPGWKYRGTYAYVLGFGRYNTATLWELQRYGDFDTFREHGDKMWQEVVGEWIEFFDNNVGEAVLLREIGDTKITEPKMERQ